MAAVIRRDGDGRILLARRGPSGPHAGLWEFPGGKVEEWEEPRTALRRELKEELDLEVEVGDLIESVHHVTPDEPILLLAYACRITRGVPKPLECLDLRWVDVGELSLFDMPPADGPIQDRLRSSYPGTLCEQGAEGPGK